MRLATLDLDYLDHTWRMIDAESVRGVKNGKVGEKVLRHGNLVTQSSIYIVRRRTRGLRTSTANENLVWMAGRL